MKVRVGSENNYFEKYFKIYCIVNQYISTIDAKNPAKKFASFNLSYYVCNQKNEQGKNEFMPPCVHQPK